MTVALLTNGIWPYVIGGMQKHSYFLCKYLAKNQINVILIHTTLDGTEIVNLDCFSAEELKFIKPVFVDTPSVRYFPGHYVYRSYLYSKAVYEALKKEEGVDFIIAKSTTAWYLFRKEKQRTVPVGINIHGYEFMQKKANVRSILESWLLRYPFVYVNKKADYVFSYGGKITDLISKLGVSRDKIIEIPAGIEREWVIDKPIQNVGKRQFVFIGRYERRKGIQELHKAICKMAPTNQVSFCFIGPIPEKVKIHRKDVEYLGIIKDKDQIKKVLQYSQILICPSYAEGMPNVILEGMASGCAIIATDVGAVRDLVDENVGLLIPPGNKRLLYDAILKFSQMPNDELEGLRNNSIKRVMDRFLWSKISEQTILSIKSKI